MTDNPYAAPAADLEAPEPVRRDPRVLFWVQRGIEVLLVTDLMLYFSNDIFDPASILRVLTFMVWAAGVFAATTPVLSPSSLTFAARAVAVAAVGGGVAWFLWESQQAGELTDVTDWSLYVISTGSGLTRVAAECLLLIVLRPILGADRKALRANTVAVWLIVLAYAANHLNFWFWRLVPIETFWDMDTYASSFTMYRAVASVVIGMLSVVALAFYLGSLVRARLHCRA